MASKWTTRLTGAQAPLWIGLLGLVLALPSVFGGLALDDHGMVTALDQGIAAWDFFGFEYLSDVRGLQERGAVGWWADPSLHMSFFRPVSSLSHALDAWAWPEAAWLMHLENAVLYGVLCLLVARLFGRLRLVGSALVVAALVFAVDDAHAQAVGWISARNHLLAGVFGTAAILAHHRWRAEGWRAGLPVALGCTGLSLLSAEAGLAYSAYVVAYALAYEPGRGWRRLVSVAPYAALVIAWRIGYVAAGYGAQGSGLYLDAGADPLGFAAAAAPRAAVLVAAQLTLPFATVANVVPGIWWPCLGLVVAALWFSRGLLRQSADARFFVLGMLGATLPFAATLPSDRLLLPVGIGAAGWIGLVVRRALHRGRRRLVQGVLAVHGWLAAAMFVPSLFLITALDGEARRLSEALTERDTVVIHVPNELPLLYADALCRGRGGSCPRHVYPLFAGMAEASIERVDARTLVMRSPEGWLASPLDRIGRSLGAPFSVGDPIELERVSVRVIAVSDDGRPLAARFRFDRPLEDFAWITWTSREPVVSEPPPIGVRVDLRPELL